MKTQKRVYDIPCQGCGKMKFSKDYPSPFKLCYQCNSKKNTEKTEECPSCKKKITEHELVKYKKCYECGVKSLKCEICDEPINNYQLIMYGVCFDCKRNEIPCPECTQILINKKQQKEFGKCFNCVRNKCCGKKKKQDVVIVFNNKDLIS